MSYQAYMPVMWLGGYSFRVAPTSMSFDQGTNIATHQILGRQDQIEPTGITAGKLSLNGFIYNATNQALQDIALWSGGANPNQYYGRPMSVGIFSQDSSSSTSSQLWFSRVGYVNAHLEYKGGYGIYRYPFRFDWVEAGPLLLRATFSGMGGPSYQFNMTSLPPGFVAAVQIIGANLDNGGTPLSLSLYDNTSFLIGVGPSLGVAPNFLFSGSRGVQSGVFNTPTLNWPLFDDGGLQAVWCSAPTGNYTVTLNRAFSIGSLPTAVNLVYVPL